MSGIDGSRISRGAVALPGEQTDERVQLGAPSTGKPLAETGTLDIVTHVHVLECCAGLASAHAPWCADELHDNRQLPGTAVRRVPEPREACTPAGENP